MKPNYECKRCGWKWESRLLDRKPKQCPGCKRIDWGRVTVGVSGRAPAVVPAKGQRGVASVPAKGTSAKAVETVKREDLDPNYDFGS